MIAAETASQDDLDNPPWMEEGEMVNRLANLESRITSLESRVIVVFSRTRRVVYFRQTSVKEILKQLRAHRAFPNIHGAEREKALLERAQQIAARISFETADKTMDRAELLRSMPDATQKKFAAQAKMEGLSTMDFLEREMDRVESPVREALLKKMGGAKSSIEGAAQMAGRSIEDIVDERLKKDGIPKTKKEKKAFIKKLKADYPKLTRDKVKSITTSVQEYFRREGVVKGGLKAIIKVLLATPKFWGKQYLYWFAGMGKNTINGAEAWANLTGKKSAAIIAPVSTVVAFAIDTFVPALPAGTALQAKLQPIMVKKLTGFDVQNEIKNAIVKRRGTDEG